MNSSELNQQIIFVTGKGGVGKSTVAAAIAWSHAQAGQKTLLVELGYQSFYQDYFHLEKVSYKPTSLKPGLDVALWSGPECLREYALHLIKVETLYRLFFENQVSRSLINVAPALSELAILGKVTSHLRKVGPEMTYDCIVVDAFSTGHMLALLRAPLGMAEAIHFGPMGDQTRAIFEILKDSAKTSFFVVSLPEELPVIESLELSKGIHETTGSNPVLLLNKFLPIPEVLIKTQLESSFANFISATQERQNSALKKLSQPNVPVKKLPFILTSKSWEIVDTLAKEFIHA